MAIPPTPVPTYPNVPQAPGVPPVRRSPFNAIAAPVILLADGVRILNMFLPSKWGIFTAAGGAAFPNTNFIGVEFKQDYRISNYPQEKGAFQSYNKVQVPWDARVTLAMGDSPIPSLPSLPGLPSSGENARAAFLAAMARQCASLDLVTLITPEATYPSANIVHFDYARTSSKGVTLLAIDIWLEEVRVTAQATFTETKSPNGAAPVDRGQVQPTSPTPAQAAIPNNLT